MKTISHSIFSIALICSLLLMAWPRGGQYAFTLIAQGKQVDWHGLRLDTTQMSAMVKSLEQGGWKYTGPAGLPPTVAKALGAYSIEAVMLGMQSLPSVLMVPVIMDFTIPPFQPEGVIQ